MGSTPTRPTKGFSISRLPSDYRSAAQSGNRQSGIKAAREAQMAERSIGNREVASSIPAAGSEVKVMAKILPIITETKRQRYPASRLRALVRKVAVIRGRSRRGSIAQTVERRSHKSVAGGSIPPRATIIERLKLLDVRF